MPTLTVTNDGFEIISSEFDRTPIRWADIKEIFAFKVDAWSFDIVCLGFRVDDSGENYEVDEDWPGFRELVSAIEDRFDIQDGWWSQVAFPAFETNYTTLWGGPP